MLPGFAKTARDDAPRGASANDDIVKFFSVAFHGFA